MTTSPSSALECQQLSWKCDNKAILKNIDLNLQTGEVLGIIGPNGAGKSSLLKMLAGVKQANSGSLRLQGEHYSSISTQHFAECLGYLEQQASVHWPLLVKKVIELGRIPHQGFSQKMTLIDQQAIDLAVDATGVEPLLERVITSLSEGEKMLVALTRILATQTQIILADEPVASLDPYHQLLIMELLQGFTRSRENFSVIVVLHDLSLAARFCDRLILMNQGAVVSNGSIATVLTEDNLKRYYKINSEIDYSKPSVLLTSRLTAPQETI